MSKLIIRFLTDRSILLALIDMTTIFLCLFGIFLLLSLSARNPCKYTYNKPYLFFQRNVAFMRIWLWVCVSWMILSTILTIIWMYSSKGELRILLLVDGEDIKLSKKTELNIALIIFYVVIVMGMYRLSC